MKILVATDFTDPSDNAVNYAFEMVKQWPEKHNSLLLFYAFRPQIPYTNVPSMPVMKNEELDKKLQNKLQNLESSLKQSIEVESVFERGNISDLIPDVVKKHKPNLIISGHRNKDVLDKSTDGSHTLEIINNISIPILTIPENARYKGLNQVLLTSDLFPLEISNHSLNFFKQMIADHKCKLNVLHVFKEGDPKYLENEIKNSAFHKEISDIDHENTAVVNKDVFSGIASYIEINRPDILGVVPRDRNFFGSLFHRSVTTNTIQYGQTPVLVLV
ncbi:MAG TPA: universal stress protein [Cyclobacteriaceae bacterium]